MDEIQIHLLHHMLFSWSEQVSHGLAGLGGPEGLAFMAIAKLGLLLRLPGGEVEMQEVRLH